MKTYIITAGKKNSVFKFKLGDVKASNKNEARKIAKSIWPISEDTPLIIEEIK